MGTRSRPDTEEGRVVMMDGIPAAVVQLFVDKSARQYHRRPTGVLRIIHNTIRYDTTQGKFIDGD